jgi:anaerobic selenocysteine-containing dehydrogenase
MWKASACILCECNCGLEIDVEERRFVRLRGDKRHPASRGYACEKAHRLDHYQNGRDRLTQPLRRRSDGSFEPIDWDTAIREVAARFAAVRDQFAGQSIFYYGGGGQGNHLPGAYASATRRALGSRYRSSALAQEKTGEFWISDRVFGGMTRADFEHCEVALFIGKNPWQSHSIPRARVTLKEIAKDPQRTLIVIDPRRTESAELADIHLQVRPGGDAWLLSALLAILVEEDLIDREFLAAHAVGAEEVIARLKTIAIGEYCARSGVAEELVRKAARAIGRAKSMASFEDLGVQMNHGSTLVSYLHRLLIALTGNLGKPGAHYFVNGLVDFASGASNRLSPVVGAPIISGLVPCNRIADEILTDHPRRYRAMLVEAANPVHSLADSARTREALLALDTLVVIDVAMTETARLGHYILPSATQFEKAEATFFNFEFPENYFHLRPRLLAPPEGVLPEAEIHARLVEALGAVGESDYQPLRERAGVWDAYAQTFLTRVMGDPRLAPLAPVVLYRTLELPDDLKEGAVVLGPVLRAALKHPAALARAGFSGTPVEAALQLFQRILESPSGVVFSVGDWTEVLARISTTDGKLHLQLDDLLAELEKLAQPEAPGDASFPFVLSAGERRSFTANTIIRDPEWRKKDAEGALRISAEDAAALGVQSGEKVRLTTRKRSLLVPVEISDTMQRGHVSLPNGLGLSYPGFGGEITTGVAPNELTDVEDRDPFVGTPWHKHVPARVERA